MKMTKTLEWLYNLWAPSMLTRYGALGYTARTGEKDKYGRTITPEQALGRWGGFNIIAPTAKQAAIEKYAITKELKSSLIKKLADPTIPKKEKQEAIEEYKRQQKEILSQ